MYDSFPIMGQTGLRLAASLLRHKKPNCSGKVTNQRAVLSKSGYSGGHEIETAEFRAQAAIEW
jgi:hypothetical protein